MTMATETLQQPQDPRGGGGGSGLKGAVLCKQPEIEEDEQDTSPGSDQSDATITATGQYSRFWVVKDAVKVGGCVVTEDLLSFVWHKQIRYHLILVYAMQGDTITGLLL